MSLQVEASNQFEIDGDQWDLSRSDSPIGESSVELTRRGFLFAYPPNRYWRQDGANRVMTPKPLNLYVHTPYCVKRCSYCLYKITLLKDNRKEEIDRYVEAVCKEIELVARYHKLEERPVQTLYFGGGTPSLLSEDNLRRIVAKLKQHFNFTEDFEFVFEVYPVTYSDRKAAALQEIGVNRISFGIQSFHSDVVVATGRTDTEEKNIERIKMALATGATVNIDLLAGLEGQTMDTWKYSVAKAIELGVQAVTVYKMELYANTEYYKGIRSNQITLPNDEQEIEFAKYAFGRLETAGYKPATHVTFTKDGNFPQRHIRNRFNGEDFYGLGVSAFGAMGDHAYQNTNSIPTYLENVDEGIIPLQRGHVLSSMDKMVRDVIMPMKNTALDYKAYDAKHGLLLPAVLKKVLDPLQREGFVTVDDTHIRMTSKGLLWGDYVGNVMGQHLKQLATISV